VQPGFPQHGPGPGGLPLLGEGKAGEQDGRLAWAMPLAVALEQDERALGERLGQGGQRRQQQQLLTGRPGAQGLLGDLARLRGPLCQGVPQTGDPKLLSLIPGLGVHVVRRRAEAGQDILPGGVTRYRASVAHGITSALA